MPGPIDIRRLASDRIDENFLIEQWNGRFQSESQTDAKDRLSDLIDLATGDWTAAYPDGTPMPGKPVIENAVRGAIYDLSRVAKESSPSFKFTPRGDSQDAQIAADVQEAIVEGYRYFGRLHRMERRLYMDLIMAGFGAVSAYHNDTSQYPIFKRLDPKFTYPRVWNGELLDVLTSETVRKSDAAAFLPGIDFDGRSDSTVQLVCFYNSECVYEGIVETQGGTGLRAHELSRWEHELGTIPVAFRQLDSVDGALRGLLDQAEGPQGARNIITQYLLDYIESMVHSPFEEKGIVPPINPPGPTTIYHHDPTAPESFMRRVPPAAPPGAVFGILQDLQRSVQTETIQPPSRTGDVSQSIASGSFVQSTQGQLTSVIKDLQDDMGILLVDLAEKAMRIDERWLPEGKPLMRPVGKKKTYKPEKDIDGWYYSKVSFGASAGVGAINGDARIMQLLGARLIDRDTARQQIDFLDDPGNIEEKVQREAIEDSILQRFAADPNTPFDALFELDELFSQGKNMREAVAAIKKRVQESQAQAQAGAGAPPAGEEGIPQPGAPVDPQAEALALEKGATGVKPGTLDVGPVRPLSQVIQRS